VIVGAPLSCRRLVGREPEVAALRARFQEALCGRGSLVIVNGEAGIGKTRLLLEALQELKRDGATVLRSQFFEHVSSPMGPLVEIFRELYTILPAAIDKRPASAVFGGPDSSIDAVIFDSRASQFASIAETLLRCASATPLVIAIEDVHWADPATLECLHYLAGRVEGARLLFIVTHRSESVDRRRNPVAEYAKLAHQANVWQLALEPLQNPEMQALVNETLPANHQLSSEAQFRILELAEGNPLFAEELLKDALESGASRLPTSVSTLFLQRLESFSSEGRFLLSQAAVIGKRFDAHLLAQVSNQSFEAILSILRTARELQIIVEDVELASSYNFRHALVREVLYEELLIDEARPLHRRIAEHLEKLPESEERTIELAYHWWAAREPAKVVQHNEAAAEIAAARFASADAVRYYDRALEFVADGALKQAELRERQARQLWVSSQLDSAIDVLGRVFVYFERHGMTDRVAEIAHELGLYYYRTARDNSVVWFERALEAMGDNKAHPVRSRCLINLAMSELRDGSLEQARAYMTASEESLFAAPPEQRAHHLQAHISLASASGDFASALAAYEKFRSFFDINKVSTFFERGLWLSTAANFLSFGALDISDYALERIRLWELAHPSLRSFTERIPVVVDRLTLGGSLAEAAELVREYWTRQTTETMNGARQYMAMVASPLAARLLRPDLIAEIAVDETVKLAFDSAEKLRIFCAAAAYAEWLATNDERARARELIARAVAVIGHQVLEQPDCAVAFALYGDAAAGRWAHDMLARWALPVSNRVGRAYLALIDAIALGARPLRATRLARLAAEGFRDAGLPYYEALALERCGNQKQALEIYRRIGDERDARRLASEIDPMNRRGRRAAELTAREREIADLIAEGKSNRKIAERLVLSQRTVETHVTSIFSKLEVSERGEIAGRVAQQR
jgi:DNA-binding CsgD family transcriptional regulator